MPTKEKKKKMVTDVIFFFGWEFLLRNMKFRMKLKI